MIKAPPPLSLYVHMPWCVRKCPYCDFNAHAAKGKIPSRSYIDTLIQDLEQDLPKIWGREIVSIFFGGGTPSLFSGEEYEYLIGQLRSRLNFSQDIEITLEANPGTVECDSFSAYLAAGINRVSLGVQSFSDEHLKTLGRIHNSQTAYEAIETLKKSGFTNFNVDIMHGLPNQTVEEAITDLKLAIQSGATHISWYQLTMEPNTLFAVQNPVLPDDKILSEIESKGFEVLAQNGFSRYEVSAFCQKGKYSRHNMNYWQFGDYLGIGAGAHSKLTFVDGNRIQRQMKHKHPKAYMNESIPFIQDESDIETEQIPLEFMLNALRLTSGVTIADFETRTGLSLEVIQNSLLKAKAKGLLEDNNNVIRPTKQGLAFLNDLLAFF